MRIAVIGTGIAGNAAAWTLSKRYPVTVYDREIRPGGHSHTVSIDYLGTPIAVDIGFIVYNELNYPDLTALNQLQDIGNDKPLLVNLNPPFAPASELTFGKYICEHLQYNAVAFAAQKR
jgi:predicted NAD/FAD-binding protein